MVYLFASRCFRHIPLITVIKNGRDRRNVGIVPILRENFKLRNPDLLNFFFATVQIILEGKNVKEALGSIVLFVGSCCLQLANVNRKLREGFETQEEENK